MLPIPTLARRLGRLGRRILVDALSLVARAHRERRSEVRFVAVTGSCGKSTTTALLAAVLARRGPVRNGIVLGPNSLARVAVAVLGTSRRHRYCVVEVSGAAPGRVQQASAFLRPDIAVVTWVREDHYKQFRGRAAVAAEKARLVEALPATGLAVLNADDPNVWAMRARTSAAVIGYGQSSAADCRLLAAHAAWPGRLSLSVAYRGASVTVRSRLLGDYAVVPILAALAVAQAEGMPVAETLDAIASVEPPPGRMCPHEAAGVTIVDDSWKAPLYTIPATLDFMRAARATRKILILGTLSDYGEKAGRTYRALARAALEVCDVVAVVGRWAASVERLRAELGPDRLLAFASLAALNLHLRSLLRPGDLVMLKGSARADHLERLLLDRNSPVACWRERCGRPRRCEGCRLLRQPG